MDKVTVATTGDASDFGDLTVARSAQATSSNGTRGVIMGGSNSFSSGGSGETIDYITIPAGGNATDFGDMATTTMYNAGTAGD